MSQFVIGRYQIKQELGRGGMAIVYLAHDPAFGRDVALKIMPQSLLHDPSFQIRFVREAKTIATLEHAAIVPVYDYGEHEGQPYLVMRYMQGGSLAERIAKRPLTLAETAVIVNRLAAALDKAHAQGVIHRDLKPGNVLFDDDGAAYLSDFGIAKIVEQTTTLTGSGVLGTPAYMSPEQAKGSKTIDGRADIYALGSIIFEMLTGRQPYQADTPIGVVVKHITEPVPDILQANPTLPMGCAALIKRAMAKEPEKRYETAGKLATTLSGLTAVSAPPPVADDKTTWEPIPPPLAEKLEKTAVADPTNPDTTLTSPPRRAVPAWGWAAIALPLLVLLVWGGISLMGNKVGSATPTATASSVATSNVVDFPASATDETASTVTQEPATATIEPEATATQLATATAPPANTPTVTRETATETAVLSPQLRINVSSVNIRSGPGTAYDVVTVLNENTILNVIARNSQGSWYNVELPGGRRGWVAQSVTEAVNEEGLTAVSIAQTIPAPPTSPPPTAVPTVATTATPPPSSGSSGGQSNPTPKPENTIPAPP